MESAVKLLVGLVLLVVSVAYLYRPILVLRFNDWARTLFFNDSHLLHYRRRWGLLAFLGSILFLYSAFLNLSKLKKTAPAPDPLLEGYRAFDERRFDAAVDVALRQLKLTPGDPHGNFLLRQARAAARRSGPKR